MAEPRSIDHLLPSDVAATASQLLRYLRHPVFSWSWWWRRMLFFAPVAIAAGLYNGNDHGAFVHDAFEGLSVAWRSAVESVWFVSGGVLLATGVRHAHLPQRWERAFIIVAVAAGFVVAVGADRWDDRHHEQLMCAHYGENDCFQPAISVDATPLGALLGLAAPAGLYFAFGGGFALLAYFSELRSWRERVSRREHERLELARNEADLRLSVLQAQIEPHFLFNTLASLRSLMRTEPGRAEATIDALVDHLRAVLPAMRSVDKAAPSTLAQQIEVCRSYLEVMRVRLGARFNYSIEVHASLLTLPFPPFMLLCLVENAVKHGVELKPGTCTIFISARIAASAERRELEVRVSDDGAGLREGFGAGTGLANIRAQLALRFGAQASLDLRGGDRGGAVATLCIPLTQP